MSVDKEEAKKPIEVTVSKDKMEALLVIRPVAEKPVTLGEVLLELRNNGVTHGIDEQAISRAMKTPEIDFVVALGKLAQNGENSYVTYSYESKPGRAPAMREDGTVDYKTLNWIVKVEKDDLLAEKIAATEGVDGFDVTGAIFPGKAGKDMPLAVGKNVRVEEGRLVFADVAGQFEIVGGKITVNPVLEVKKDVNMETGNIDFNGSIVVRGSVQDGFSVKCPGDVEVQGVVAGGSVSGKNIIVRKGIIGGRNTLVAAEEKLSALFIENAIVTAGGDVNVGDFVLHSKVSSGGSIIVEGKRGLIAGGSVKARRGIRARNIGTNMFTPTVIEVGIIPQLREEYKKLKLEFVKQEKIIGEADKALKILKALPTDKLTEDKQSMLSKLTRTFFIMSKQLDEMKKRMGEIEAIVEESKRGEIKVSGSVFPGVIISIGSVSKSMQDVRNAVRFYIDDGEIITGI